MKMIAKLFPTIIFVVVSPLFLSFSVVVVGSSTTKSSSVVVVPPFHEDRPQIVRDALENNKDLYYFGIGSNMLRSKLENRSLCKTKIHLKSFEPAFVRNHRLAFNMRGFPPLEPGMGSLEPISITSVDDDDSAADDQQSSRPLLAYEKNQCHGALVRVSAEDYNKIMISEGIGTTGRPDQAGYEEVVVEATPYNKKGRRRGRPVQAIALRAREHVRLKSDPAPSKRYMTILREGAEELGLDPSYKEFLRSHPEARVSPITRKLAVCNLVWTATVSFRFKLRVISKLQNAILWRFYVPPTTNNTVLKVFLSELVTAVVLFPGAMFGSLMLVYYSITGRQMSAMMSSLVKSHW